MKKKILFLIHTLGGGGAEKVLVNLVNNMDKNKYDITVMTIIDVGELRYQLNENIKYKTTINLRLGKRKIKCENKSGSLLNRKGFLKLGFAKIYSLIWRYISASLVYKVFIKEKYDIEVAFLEGISAKVIAASTNKKSRKYVWVHVDLINQTKSSKVFKGIQDEKKTYCQFNKVICVSEAVKIQFIKKFDFIPNKVLVKYNVIDKEDILKKSKYPIENINNSIGRKVDTFLICSIGRLNAQKAYDRLLRIVKRLIDEEYDIKLIIIGEGTAKEELEKYIVVNNLEEKIKLLGFKSNPYNYLGNSKLYVCSSVAEGFSTAVSEAIVLGIPVVTTDCAGMKEMLGSNNEYGIVTPNSEEALYVGIKNILNDKMLYMKYKEAIQERSEIFNLKYLISEVEKLFDE